MKNDVYSSDVCEPHQALWYAHSRDSGKRRERDGAEIDFKTRTPQNLNFMSDKKVNEPQLWKSKENPSKNPSKKGDTLKLNCQKAKGKQGILKAAGENPLPTSTGFSPKATDTATSQTHILQNMCASPISILLSCWNAFPTH